MELDLDILRPQERLALRLATAADHPDHKNSVLTFMRIREKEWLRLLRNKKILYKEG